MASKIRTNTINSKGKMVNIGVDIHKHSRRVINTETVEKAPEQISL